MTVRRRIKWKLVLNYTSLWLARSTYGHIKGMTWRRLSGTQVFHKSRMSRQFCSWSIYQFKPFRFTVSMANFATFENDERTRAFVSIEVGAGHSQVRVVWTFLTYSSLVIYVQLADLSNSLSNMLNSLRQKVFYAEPRFHASFGWALLRQPLPQPSPSGSGVRHIQTFPVIEALPTSLTSELSNKFGEAVASKICASEVGEIRAKIGKDVFHWNLGQSCWYLDDATTMSWIKTTPRTMTPMSSLSSPRPSSV